MDKTKAQQIIKDYKEIIKATKEITEAELISLPLQKHETKQDRIETHRIDMLEMYTGRNYNKDLNLEEQELPF